MLYAFQFNYAGLEIDAAQDQDGQIWISTPTIENLLGFRSDSTRKLLASESFKAFVAKGSALGNFSKKDKSTSRNTINLYYSKEAFLKIIYFVSDYQAYCIGHIRFGLFDKCQKRKKQDTAIFN